MSVHDSFVHLRVHSEYSVSEGAARLSPKDKKDKDSKAGTIAYRAAELGMPALGLADLGNIFGAVKFYEACRDNGVKPIIGCEMPLTEGGAHLLLLCANADGYRRLNLMLTRAYAENGGKIAPQWLQDDNAGLIALSGGERGEIGCALKNGDEKRALAAAHKWRECFPDRFYVETWRANGEDAPLTAAASAIAEKTRTPLVATHPVQCACKEDLQMLEIRRCIAHNWPLNADWREGPFADPPHLLTAEEMKERFADLPGALENSLEIAKRCNFSYPEDKVHLPRIELPGGEESSAMMLLRLSQEGLRARGIPEDKRDEYEERLQYELEVISEMKYADYYLIVADFVGWAKQQNIPVGPGRGSGAASLIAYAIGITELDPIFYGLLFERFLNRERVSLPDFDIDFCVDGRDKVIDYVTRKYGSEHVSQIVTFGQIGARSAVRDVGRVLGLPYSLCDRVARAIPGAPDMTIDRALEESPQLKDEQERSEEIRELISLSRKVEGLPRNIGTHAGGVLISPEPIVNYCPLYAAADTNSLVSQMDMIDIEKTGLVKFDFLGLKTLTILAHAEQMLHHAGALPDDFSWDDIPSDDADTFAVYGSGELKGVFQCESRGMRDMMRRMKPDRFNHIIALIALYRPGPMQFMDQFIECKHGLRDITYPHPLLKDSLSETYGLWIYQEQVMETARIIAGYSLNEADLLRRAMGKKKADVMAGLRERFVKGASDMKTLSAENAEALFDKLSDFANYGFNKAHAAAYALVSYRTAYLKAHHPAALYAAAMSASGSDKDLKEFVTCARAEKISIHPPDINKSGREFYLDQDGGIVFGLKAIKGAGNALIDDIVKARGDKPFTSLFDFCRRLSGSRQINRAAAEHFACAGAFDSIHPNRAAVLETLPSALAEGSSGTGLFGEAALADSPPWSAEDRLAREQTALGFALSGNFYSLYHDFLHASGLNRQKLADLPEDMGRFRVAAVVDGIISPRAMRRRGMKLLMLDDDKNAGVEIAADAGLIESLGKLKEGRDLLIIEGDARRGRLRADKIWTMEGYIAERAKRITAACSRDTSAAKLCETLTPAKDETGTCEIALEYQDDSLRCVLSLGSKWRPGILLCNRLKEYAPRGVTIEFRNN